MYVDDQLSSFSLPSSFSPVDFKEEETEDEEGEDGRNRSAQAPTSVFSSSSSVWLDEEEEEDRDCALGGGEDDVHFDLLTLRLRTAVRPIETELYH